ncbi:hypothetical protein BDN72DRAFT_366990 [Pluteus cervinus]|uniref:Uncharacterized protein n=1 Tax=Pluteus cervinus TaxID=181527 RepID=A0ACD3BDL9_9AGAR|nr:hypothetical protein BDN72DRAFT_366990 [Pluteus cervinus]
MSTAPAPNRASLLAGLRTGGVRSTSANIPHTAAPGGSFNVSRYPSQQHPSFYPDEEDDQLAEVPIQNIFVHHPGARMMPMTAAVDGPNNRFSQHQTQRGMNPNFNQGFAPNMVNPNQMVDPAFQMQMMQVEIMRMQALQVQQMLVQQQQQQQAQRQAQAQQQQQQQNRRASAGFVAPATAGPTTNSFDLRSATLSAQLRRANQADQVKLQLGVPSEDQVPMTAALGGKFGSRTTSLTMNGNRYSDDDVPPPTPGNTTVISGGTSLGNPASNNVNVNVNTPSKSDTATSWRRGGNNNSVLSGNNRAVSSPSVKITPPPGERVSPPPVPPVAKARPQPLQFSSFVSQPSGVVATTEVDVDDAPSSGSTKSNGSSPPITPDSLPHDYPLSPREEASKKLYEGLGLGRPTADAVVQPQQSVSVANHRMVSQPMRQPRGPPSGNDELGPKNFARMVRRKAIGGLGMLANARERREFVEAY